MRPSGKVALRPEHFINQKRWEGGKQTSPCRRELEGLTEVAVV